MTVKRNFFALTDDSVREVFAGETGDVSWSLNIEV